ncbi:MAG: hypothetical protein RL215_3004 [Planctomycetota bacterium]
MKIGEVQNFEYPRGVSADCRGRLSGGNTNDFLVEFELEDFIPRPEAGESAGYSDEFFGRILRGGFGEQIDELFRGGVAKAFSARELPAKDPGDKG